MKELKGAILSQNHRRSQGGGPGGPGSLNRNATNDKIRLFSQIFVIGGISIEGTREKFDKNLTKKSYFAIFSFF